MQSTLIVQIKGYGDFIMAARSVALVTPASLQRSELKILTGEHIWGLARALRTEPYCVPLSSGPTYPAAFDLRSRGIWHGLRSLIQLRRLFAAAVPRNKHLLFDHSWWREKLLSHCHAHTGLLPEENVYSAYATTLRTLGYESRDPLDWTPPSIAAPSGEFRATIIPSSRVARKCMPPSTIARIADQLQRYGRCEVLEIPGEAVELPRAVPTRKIERSFEALIAALSASDVIVSTDSLPAHLAEYLGVPTFVATPVPNSYWFPALVFKQQAWCVFGEEQRLAAWLAQHSAARRSAAAISNSESV